MTHLTDATQTFSRPRYQGEGPATSCMIDGRALGWTNCTPASFAMALDATTGGKRRPDPCSIRRDTGDTSGGTTLRQNADAVMKRYGVFVATYTGANVLSPARVAQYVRAGHRVVIQGNADAMIGTSCQSTTGPVNHAVMVNEVRGGTIAEPHEALVYDPAADGRRPGIDQGPTWWPWSLVKTFCAHLRPSGETGTRLGPGMVYAAVFPDSEPHWIQKGGAVKAHPFPDRTRAAKPTVWVHSTLKRGVPTRLYSVPRGTLLVGFQYGRGDTYQGSDLWLGNDDGTEWVHTKNLSHVGGDT